ncbi:MAG: 4,5-DOPA dioxygenase extradiol [Neisseria sp.]|uniref:4,5-DOPA-extradiol-dioxygenase n=1 Tax=Neisseria sp. TaxID=192066 RepID=UPI0026DC4298|nr:4,5-DOPA dioxygenase extradiol [Neisseria sp.]MDO4640721.1 4,5-DOPA dioxygenase extradiol [Neisseria sp.]
MTKLPTVFLGHGSPMNAITDTDYGHNWRKLGQHLRQHYDIRAILAVSAHWCTEGTAVTAMPQPRTIHDFGGFPQALYDMHYPAPGSPELAQTVRALLKDNNIAADYHWGLDHGTWGVLCHVFPEADIPVVQLSLNVRLSAEGHFDLGRQLAPLREQGILIVGSGNIVHNLRAADFSRMDNATESYAWAESARAWVNERLRSGNIPELANEQAYPEALRLAAPTPEHYWPLLYIAGAAQTDEPICLFNDDIVGKSLSMTSVLIGDTQFHDTLNPKVCYVQG